MKVSRHAKILEIINSKDIDTQEELAEELKKLGMNVTQATVSRDIKELKLIKVLGNTGKYKYASINHTESYMSDKLVNIFVQTVISVENIDKFIIIKTVSGSAPGAGEAMDSFGFDGIAGTIAGDNTLLAIARTTEKAQEITVKLRKILTS
ncbi:arginine repressor [Clostridium sp. FAM 1755]|uniref:Arginine repressor n=2 Tax=Clostridium TaxID=1485 RepID=A0A6M0T0M6_CLOBO|nr:MULTISPECIES: arginine repressor [Clostridium]NFA61338.1 arginine repressor [Clostridium botulinum]KOR26679.1 arginine repressor ArgR [Clostridium sp. L74]MDS1002513.1 arginine repressor [Clostridium sporogenes]NFI74941.1 arginine repressor [Clostridium sporogenes]NFL73232.1 arginine repressor [Clostridium sporogenes]